MQVIPPIFFKKKKKNKVAFLLVVNFKRKIDFLSSPQNGDAGYAFPVCLLKV